MNALVEIRALMNAGQVLFAQKRAAAASQTVPNVSTTSKAVAAKANATAASATTPAASGKAASASTGTTATGTTATSTTATGSQDLDRDAFLQLLVCQMQNQDPLSPTDNTQMIAQLAQFSSLEQMNNLNTSFSTVKTGIDQLDFMSAGSMVGRQISGLDSTGATVEGKVERVYLDTTGGGVYLVVDGKPIAMSTVQQINQS